MVPETGGNLKQRTIVSAYDPSLGDQEFKASLSYTGGSLSYVTPCLKRDKLGVGLPTELSRK